MRPEVKMSDAAEATMTAAELIARYQLHRGAGLAGREAIDIASREARVPKLITATIVGRALEDGVNPTANYIEGAPR